ncbi:MAG: hypothetical protein ACC726_00460 [Chloroflexota bacterium]
MRKIQSPLMVAIAARLLAGTTIGVAASAPSATAACSSDCASTGPGRTRHLGRPDLGLAGTAAAIWSGGVHGPREPLRRRLRRVTMARVVTMRAALTAILLASLVVSTSPGASAQSDGVAALTEADAVHAQAVAASVTPLRALFIGNSHTYTNGGIDWHVSRMATVSKPWLPFKADAETISGATLELHYQRDSQGPIPEGDYDVVILQGHIPRSGDRTAASFLKYARLFDAITKESGAETVFFMSWTHPDFPGVKLKDIVRAHRQISAELGAKVAPVALAMQKVRKERPRLKMRSDDGVHASWAGSYLAAAVIYATIFERSPVGLDYTFGVTEGEAAYLQRIAWKTVVDWNKGS